MDFGRTAMRFVLLTAVLLWTGQALAADAPAKAPAAAPAAAPAKAAEPAHWHTMNNDFMNAFHHPFDGLEMGLDMRLRNEYNHNTTSFDNQFGDGVGRNTTKKTMEGNWNEENAQRYRMRWSTMWTLAPDVTFNTRLVWEFWTFNTERTSSTTSSDQNLELREAIFDWMNIKWKNAFDAPMTLTVGRQDIMLGTGWLVGDGTPGDGSRTMYFDAVRATIDLSDKTQLDLIGIAQSDDEETWLPPFGHQDWLSVTKKQDETGFIAYVTDKSIENTTLEAYYIYKKDDSSDYSKYWYGKGKFWSPSSIGRDDEIHTLGGRIAQKLDSNWSYSVEAAKQFGRKDMGTGDMESMKGLGTNDSLTYAFNDEMKNELRTGFEYLSGDDNGTGGSEAFDPLWGEYPQSQRGYDTIGRSYTYETSGYEVTNLYRWNVIGHTFKPIKDWTFMSDYQLLWAEENNKGGTGGNNAGPEFDESGYFRGQLFSWMAKYSCCKSFNTYLQVDYFVPGNYYDESTQNHGLFARLNLEWTF
jgi:hypothetical protein